jgi:hypothetical protein
MADERKIWLRGSIKALFHETDGIEAAFCGSFRLERLLLVMLFSQIAVRSHKNGLTGVGSGCCCAALAFLPVPRWAGVTHARYLLFGANTPLCGTG